MVVGRWGAAAYLCDDGHVLDDVSGELHEDELVVEVVLFNRDAAAGLHDQHRLALEQVESRQLGEHLDALSALQEHEGVALDIVGVEEELDGRPGGKEVSLLVVWVLERLLELVPGGSFDAEQRGGAQ